MELIIKFIIILIIILIMFLILIHIIKKHPNILFNNIGKIYVDPKTGLGRFKLETKYVENLKNNYVILNVIHNADIPYEDEE